MNENKIIALFTIIVIVLGGVLAVRIFFDKSDGNIMVSRDKPNNVKKIENSLENSNNEEKEETIEDGIEYAERKTKESQDNMNSKIEKEDLQIIVGLVMFGEKSMEELTYDGLNEQLKNKFGEGNYELSGPDDNGIFHVKLNNGTYNIDKSGKVLN